VQELLQTIREECSPATWSRAVTLARTGTLTGKRGRDGGLELRIATKGGMMSPLITLMPDDEDWSCECPSHEGVCQHVAAAVIALAQAEKDGSDLLSVQGPGGTLAYALSERDGKLCLARHVKRESGTTPLTTRLTQEKQRGGQSDVATSRADMEIDILLGTPQAGPLPKPIVRRVLSQLAECDDVTFEGKPIGIGDPVPSVTARVERHRDGFRIVAGKDPSVTRTFDNGAVLSTEKLCPIAEVELSRSDLSALEQGRVYALGEVADLVGRVIPALEAKLPVRVPQELLPGAEDMAPRLAFQADIMAGVLEVLPTIVYGDPPSARIDGGRMTYLGGPVPRRDPDGEQKLARLLEQRMGLEVGRRKRLEGEAAVRLAERIRGLGDAQVTGSGLSAFSMRGELTPDLSLESGQFGLGFVTAAGERASAEAVVAAWQHGSPLVALSGGGFAPLPSDFLRAHGHLVMDLLAARDEQDGTLAPSALPDLARLCDALDHPAPPELAPLRALVSDFHGIPDEALPEGVTAELRSYQKTGVSWLRFLSKAGLGALLADDMGLGKTLQALCAMELPALVVCPASVLFNWASEIERFRPSLRVSTYHGPNRRLDPQADITLTTYAVMRLDVDVLSAREFQTVVLDEAQTIKNPDSQVTRAAFELRAKTRVALTGTPVENRLTDLWSQFHFLNRGLLGGRRDFEERYAKPIGEGDRAAASRLRERIKPFVLRRLKRDVAKELPPRTDVVLRCTLDADEQALYDSVLAATRSEIVDELAQGGSVLAALEALLRLRQACCHRALLPGQTAPSSSKLELLLETLEEALSEGHKALVFSQWTSLLDLIEPLLKARGVRFTRLDGSTPDRGAVVKSFQDDDSMSVMLLSLKAGGVGLNLTAADHVFLMDPWWNPAAEDQAADRAHRIGQDRPVLVHRLVAAETVEERILALQEKKRSLAQVATDGAAQAASITRDDLLALLR
jgi:superfamily II DNA or RNA helicase